MIIGCQGVVDISLVLGFQVWMSNNSFGIKIKMFKFFFVFCQKTGTILENKEVHTSKIIKQKFCGFNQKIQH